MVGLTSGVSKLVGVHDRTGRDDDRIIREDIGEGDGDGDDRSSIGAYVSTALLVEHGDCSMCQVTDIM